MKKKLHVRYVALFALAICTASSAKAETWYQDVKDASDSDRAITKPNRWVNDVGTRADSFNSEDAYIVRNNCDLRVRDDKFTGGALCIGFRSGADAVSYGRILHYSGSPSFNNLCLNAGKYQLTFYSSSHTMVRDMSFNANSLIVSTPASDPFVFYLRNGFDYSDCRLTINAPLVSEVGAGVCFGMDGQGTNFTVVIEKDCSEYDGCITLVPSKEVAFGTWDTSLLLGNTVIAGTVRLTGGTAIEAKSGVGTVGSLLLEPNSVIEVSGSTQASGYINVRDSFEANGPVAVKLNFDPRQDDSDAASVTVLTVPMAAQLDIEDFILDTGSVEVGAQYCGLAIVEDEATVQKSLVVRFNKAVKQLSHYDDENNINNFDSNSSFTNENAWSDYTIPHSNVHYYSKDHYLRTKPQSRTTGYEFPGLSFTADGGQLILDSKSFKVPEYHTRGRHQIWLGAKYFNEERRIVTDRFVASSGIVTLAACKGQTLTVEGRISGNALLYLRGASNQSRPQGNYRLKGVNTGFIGNIYVEQQDPNCDFESCYQTLYVEDGRNLGGRKPEFDESALKLAANSRLSVTNSNVILEAGLNRGLSIKDSGRLYVDKNLSLTVNWPIAMEGTMYKEGEGVLALGGSVNMKKSYSKFVVTNGYVKVMSADCVNGLPMVFAPNAETGLKLDYLAEDATLVQYGLRNVATDTPFIGNATINVAIDNISYGSYTSLRRRKLGLITVKTAVADDVASRINLVRPFDMVCKVVRDDDPDTGHTTFSALFSAARFKVIIR